MHRCAWDQRATPSCGRSPSRRRGAADLPALALAVGCQDEGALAGADEDADGAHRFLPVVSNLSNGGIGSQFCFVVFSAIIQGESEVDDEGTYFDRFQERNSGIRYTTPRRDP